MRNVKLNVRVKNQKTRLINSQKKDKVSISTLNKVETNEIKIADNVQEQANPQRTSEDISADFERDARRYPYSLEVNM